jgi:hypothetical protein
MAEPSPTQAFARHLRISGGGAGARRSHHSFDLFHADEVAAPPASLNLVGQCILQGGGPLRGGFRYPLNAARASAEHPAVPVRERIG